MVRCCARPCVDGRQCKQSLTAACSRLLCAVLTVSGNDRYATIAPTQACAVFNCLAGRSGPEVPRNGRTTTRPEPNLLNPCPREQLKRTASVLPRRAPVALWPERLPGSSLKALKLWNDDHRDPNSLSVRED